jgi:FlaA1/EpsC-like NDP-sugar epimerase
MFWHRFDRFLARWRPHRRPLTLLLDAGTIVVCWNFTYLFRLGFERWWSERPSYDGWVLLGMVAVYLTVFVIARVPEGLWRFSGFGEVQRLTVSCGVAGALSAVAVLMLQLYGVPRAVLALHPIVTLMGLCMTRMAYRMLYEHTRARITGGASEVRRAIVMGAGEAARLLVAGLPQQGWTVLGLLDDDPAKRGARIANAPVLGSFDDVLKPSVTAGATHIITALPTATAAQRRRAIELAAATALPVLTVPSISEGKSSSRRSMRSSRRRASRSSRGISPCTAAR